MFQASLPCLQCSKRCNGRVVGDSCNDSRGWGCVRAAQNLLTPLWGWEQPRRSRGQGSRSQSRAAGSGDEGSTELSSMDTGSPPAGKGQNRQGVAHEPQRQNGPGGGQPPQGEQQPSTKAPAHGLETTSAPRAVAGEPGLSRPSSKGAVAGKGAVPQAAAPCGGRNCTAAGERQAGPLLSAAPAATWRGGRRFLWQEGWEQRAGPAAERRPKAKTAC